MFAFKVRKVVKAYLDWSRVLRVVGLGQISDLVSGV